MTRLCQEDGCTYLSRGEEYHVSGYVTMRAYVSFNTTAEPGDSDFDDALMDALDFDDLEIITDDLDYEVEVIEREWEND